MIGLESKKPAKKEEKGEVAIPIQESAEQPAEHPTEHPAEGSDPSLPVIRETMPAEPIEPKVEEPLLSTDKETSSVRHRKSSHKDQPKDQPKSKANEGAKRENDVCLSFLLLDVQVVTAISNGTRLVTIDISFVPFLNDLAPFILVRLPWFCSLYDDLC